MQKCAKLVDLGKCCSLSLFAEPGILPHESSMISWARKETGLSRATRQNEWRLTHEGLDADFGILVEILAELTACWNKAANTPNPPNPVNLLSRNS